MTTIFDKLDWLDNNEDRIILELSIGKELVDKLEAAGVKYTINEDRSVIFENCPEELLEEVRQAKNREK